MQHEITTLQRENGRGTRNATRRARREKGNKGRQNKGGQNKGKMRGDRMRGKQGETKATRGKKNKGKQEGKQGKQGWESTATGKMLKRKKQRTHLVSLIRLQRFGLTGLRPEPPQLLGCLSLDMVPVSVCCHFLCCGLDLLACHNSFVLLLHAYIIVSWGGGRGQDCKWPVTTACSPPACIHHCCVGVGERAGGVV